MEIKSSKGVALSEVKDILREKFFNKECRIRGTFGGSETTYDNEGNEIVRIVAGQDFNTVVGLYRMAGPPSGWYWTANFLFENGLISSTFTKISDVEVKE